VVGLHQLIENLKSGRGFLLQENKTKRGSIIQKIAVEEDRMTMMQKAGICDSSGASR
jgi:hypothetical protein